MSGDGSAPEPGGLAHKLDRLFETMRPSPAREYTHDEVARAIAAAGGPTISGTYVWQLRSGRRDNPTKRHLEALATFFGVAPAYFFDDERAEVIDRQLDLAVAMRDAKVRTVALRASGLSTESIDAVLSMLDRVRELEGMHDGGIHGKGAQDDGTTDDDARGEAPG
jgi:transcriptional regulator with XRE-family HTH domain